MEVLGSALRHGVEPETEERDSDVERILRDYKHLIVPGDADLPPGLPSPTWKRWSSWRSATSY